MVKINLTLILCGALCLFGGATSALALPINGNTFGVWLQNLEQEAIAQGISPETTHAALDSAFLDDRVVALDQKQPEGTVSFASYAEQIVTPEMVREGRAMMDEHEDLLDAISETYGVAPQIIVALWGIESHFGRNSGKYQIVDSLVTLAYEGRRAEFFRNELFNALRILDQEHIPATALRGSWAGAMGQCQFMPSTYLGYAVDYAHHGRRDIWGTTPDVLASIANYLAAEGWNRDLTWGREVELTQPVDARNIGLSQSRSLQEWSDLGVRNLDGDPLPVKALQASLIQPDGADGRSFIVYDNFRALMRWNRSTYFGLTVGLLADQLR